MENTNKLASSVAWPTTKEKSLDWVCQWSLSACFLQFMRAAFRVGMALPNLELLTPVQAAKVVAIHNATLWLSVAGCGAAVLAMLLEGRTRMICYYRALAGVALASTVAVHCVLSCSVGVIFITAPKDELLVGSVMTAAVFIFFAFYDAKAALFLLGAPGAGGEEEEEY